MLKPQKHTIESLSVWLDKPAIQQAFTTLASPIIEASSAAKVYSKEVVGQLYGDEKGFYPMAGEVEIGQAGDLTVKLVIEPRKGGGWIGESLTHDPINAIGISNMQVDGKALKSKQGDQ